MNGKILNFSKIGRDIGCDDKTIKNYFSILERGLHDRFTSGSIAFGNAFEHFLILEFYRQNSILQKDYRLSYFMTKESQEIDLILSRGRKTIAIEIKSKEKIDESEVKQLARLGEELKATEKFYLSRDPHATQLHGVQCLPWEQGLRSILEE